jgi:uncharacterized protein YxjI
MNTLVKLGIISVIVGAAYVAGCGDERQTSNRTPSNTIQSAAEDKLRNAHEVLVDEVVFCWGKEYEIKVNGETVAKVEGKNVNWWEDRFILKTTDGKILCSETENKRVFEWNRAAEFYDGDNTFTGYISEQVWEDMFKWSHVFHIYDPQQQELGRTEKKYFSWLDRIELFDMQGNMDYLVKGKFTINDQYTISIRDKNSVIPLEKVIMLTCIEDAIKDAEASESSDDDDDD